VSRARSNCQWFGSEWLMTWHVDFYLIDPGREVSEGEDPIAVGCLLGVDMVVLT
jgi:hypothetical protein